MLWYHWALGDRVNKGRIGWKQKVNNVCVCKIKFYVQKAPSCIQGEILYILAEFRASILYYDSYSIAEYVYERQGYVLNKVLL